MKKLFSVFNYLFSAYGSDKEWGSGRQEGGYELKQLFSFWFKNYLIFDIIMLQYFEGTEIPPHRDPEVGLRLNFVWKNTASGGQFNVRGKKLKIGPLIIFSPRNTHYVTKVISGSRHVFSIGFGSGIPQMPDFTEIIKQFKKLKPFKDRDTAEEYSETAKTIDIKTNPIYLPENSQYLH